MRMQFDETSLLGTAYGMRAERAALMPIGALPTADGLSVTDWNLDKRPPLWPFLVSVAHDVAGVRVGNAFAANAVVLWALLALVGWRLRAAAGRAAGALAIALLAGLPLLASCATSAGFEALALALLAAAIAAAVDFLRAPSAARGNALLATVLLGAQARYESLPVLLVLLAAVAVAARSGARAGAAGGPPASLAAVVRGWPRDRATGWLLACAPLLLAPLALLLAHGRDPMFYPEAKGQPLVALAHFADHAGPLLAAVFAWGPQPFAAMPTLLAVAAGMVALARPAGRAAAACVALPVAAATAIALLWFYGDVREETAQRLFLPLAALLALLPALACAAWRAPKPALALLAAALAAGAWNLAALRGERVLPRYAAAVMLDAVDAALGGLRPEPRRTLLVSAVAQYLIVRGYAAATPQQFLARRPRLPDAVDVVVLATPLDDACRAQAGDPRDVLAGRSAQLLGEVPGALRVAAWRLGR